jgi:hypothetical protein
MNVKIFKHYRKIILLLKQLGYPKLLGLKVSLKYKCSDNNIKEIQYTLPVSYNKLPGPKSTDLQLDNVMPAIHYGIDGNIEYCTNEDIQNTIVANGYKLMDAYNTSGDVFIVDDKYIFYLTDRGIYNKSYASLRLFSGDYYGDRNLTISVIRGIFGDELKRGITAMINGLQKKVELQFSYNTSNIVDMNIVPLIEEAKTQ